jgi:hypothetical protein
MTLELSGHGVPCPVNQAYLVTHKPEIFWKRKLHDGRYLLQTFCLELERTIIVD